MDKDVGFELFGWALYGIVGCGLVSAICIFGISGLIMFIFGCVCFGTGNFAACQTQASAGILIAFGLVFLFITLLILCCACCCIKKTSG